MNKENQPYAFVSYAHKNAQTVLPIVAALTRMACNLWYDEGIESGSLWNDDVAKKLDGAACVLFFVSADSVASTYVAGEINFAVARRKPIFPIYIEKTTLPLGLELLIGQIQAIFAYEAETIAILRKKLIAALPSEIFFEASVPFHTNNNNTFFLNNTSTEFPENTYFEGEMNCSYSVGFSKTANADEQEILFEYNSRSAYDMECKVTAVVPFADKYTPQMNDKIFLFNLSFFFMGRYPTYWPDIDAGITFAVYDADGQPKIQVANSSINHLEIYGEGKMEDAQVFAENVLAEILAKIQK